MHFGSFQRFKVEIDSLDRIHEIRNELCNRFLEIAKSRSKASFRARDRRFSAIPIGQIADNQTRWIGIGIR